MFIRMTATSGDTKLLVNGSVVTTIMEDPSSAGCVVNPGSTGAFNINENFDTMKVRTGAA